MKSVFKILSRLPALLAVSAAMLTASCSMADKENPNDNGGKNDRYVDASIIVGGTVYYDAGPESLNSEGEDGGGDTANYVPIEGLRIRMAGTDGADTTNRYGSFVITAYKNIDRYDTGEYVMLEIADIDGEENGGLFAAKTVKVNIGMLAQWISGELVARANGLEIFVELKEAE